jgi:hypothetical protein
MTIRQLKRRCEFILPIVVLLVAGSTVDLSARATDSEGLISIHLEQREGTLVRTVPQNTVFHTGDILRFRITSHIAGFLYVVDKGTTGATATLFPASADTADNTIGRDQNYLVPADGDGWFKVSGPSGFDILYFLVSATPIELPPAASGGRTHETPEAAPPPPGLLPRCDDQIFKARGECLDPSAGVAPLTSGAPVPRELVPLAKTASRDIILTDDGDGTAVQAASTATLPLIYTFRLAHRE